MKLNTLKTLIKEVVKEAIQEELKDILLEAIRSPKQTIVESVQQPLTPVVDGPAMSSNERRAAFDNIMGDMHSQFSSNDVAPKFNPNGVVPGGDLPQGTVDMEQIKGLMSSK